MYSVMIVDNEPGIVTGLKLGIRWEELNCTVAGTAADGTDALEMIKKAAPDILLSDVKMDHMDGITLCREMHQMGIPTKCILITGYQDFSVAMSAANLPNIIQILLKPTSVFTVTKAVQDAVSQLEAEQARTLLEARIRKKESENQKLQASLLLSHLSAQPRRDLAGRFAELGFCTESFFVMQLRCKIFNTQTPPDYQQIRDYVDRIFSEFICIPITTGNSFTYKYFFPVPAGDTAFNSRLISSSHDLINVIDCCSDVSAYIGFSTEHFSVMELPSANDESDSAVQFALYQADIPVVLYSDIPGDSANWYDSFQPAMTNILESIGLFNFEQTKAGLDNLLEKAIMATLPPDYFRQLCMLAIDSCFEQIYRLNRLENDFVAAHARSWKRLQACATLEALCAATVSIIEENMQKQDSAPSQDMVSQVKKYVSQNYRQELSLESIAEAFFISPSYLSRLFKQKTSMNLVTYIQETRIEEARKLALNTDMHAYEIGEAVGISDPVYFSKLFKKKTGYNISKFREKMKE